MLVTIPSGGFYRCEFRFVFSFFYASPLFVCVVSHTNYEYYVFDVGIQLSGFKIKLEGGGRIATNNRKNNWGKISIDNESNFDSSWSSNIRF
jgi:hypothetical protein